MAGPQEEGKTVPFLVAGQRRLYAALAYMKDNPEYLIQFKWVDPKTARQQLILNIRENVGHKALNIIDVGTNALRLRDEPTEEGGLTLDAIAEILNVSQPQVSQAIKLVEGLPETAQRAIASGKVKIDDALTILKVPDVTRRAALIDEFLNGNKMPLNQPEQPVGQEDRPVPEGAGVVTSNPVDQPPARTVREAARDEGAKVSVKMGEFKQYLQEAIDEDGPGSNKGEVALKKAILKFLNGEITSRKTLDNHFQTK